jgi:hypothetical protein
MRNPLTDYCNNHTSRNCESLWLVQCRPTPKLQHFSRKSTAGVGSIKTRHPSSLSDASIFGRPGLLSKYSRYLPHSTNHANRIRTMWTTLFCFEASKATEQNNNGLGQTKRTSIISHLPRSKCWQGQNTRQFDTGNRRIGALRL